MSNGVIALASPNASRSKQSWQRLLKVGSQGCEKL